MRIFFMIIGGLSLVLGLIGVVVPLLPTIPFSLGKSRFRNEL